MADFPFKHFPSPQYLTTSATGLIVSGPMPDGSVLLCFHRDCFKVVSETYDIPDTLPPNTTLSVDSVPRYEIEPFREDVVTIGVSPDVLEAIVRVLIERLDIVRAQTAQPVRKLSDLSQDSGSA